MSTSDIQHTCRKGFFKSCISKTYLVADVTVDVGSRIRLQNIVNSFPGKYPVWKYCCRINVVSIRVCIPLFPNKSLRFEESWHFIKETWILEHIITHASESQERDHLKFFTCLSDLNIYIFLLKFPAYWKVIFFHSLN